MIKLIVLMKLAWACITRPQMRIGQILADAIESYSAINARNDLYYVGDAQLLWLLSKFNKDRRNW